MQQNNFWNSKYFYLGLVILTIASGALFLFWPELSGKLLFNGNGLYHYMFFAATKYFVYGLHMLPNWWPAYSSGYPVSLTSNAFLNPLFILTLKFLPPFLANNLMIFVFFVINGLSFYVLARALKLSRTGSLIASISYAFSGAVMRWLIVTVFTVIQPFLPLSFLCCLKIMSGKKRWFWPWLLLLVFSWISGFAELMIYCIVAVSCFAAYLIVKEKRKGNLAVYSNAILFFGAIVLSILLLSPWFFSVLHFVSFSERSGAVSMENASALSITFSTLIHMLNPRINIFYGENIPFIPFGTDENSIYIGTLPLLLVLAALFIKQKGKKEHLIFFLCLFAGMILLTIKYSPLFWLIHHLPMLDKFRGLWKWPLITVFAAAIVAGYGFDNIKDFFRHRFSKYIVNGLLILLCVAVLGAGTLAVFEQKIKSTIASYGISHYQSVSGRIFVRSTEYYQHLINRMAESIVDNFSLKNKWVILAIILWSLAIIHLMTGRKELLKPRTWRVFAIIITWLGSVLIWTRFTGAIDGPPVSYLTQKPQTAEFLDSRNAYASNQLPLDNAKSKIMVPYRISLYTPDQFVAIVSEKYKVDLADGRVGEVRQWFTYEMMDYNINFAFNFDFFESHEPLGLARLTALGELFTYGVSRATAAANPGKFDDYLKNFFTERNFRRLGMSNIKYILSPLTSPNTDSQFKPIFTAYTKDGIPVHIYENPYFLPRWYFANNIQWTEPENALENLQKISDFRKTTLLEKINLNDPAIVTKADPGDKFEVQLYTAGELIIKTNTKNYRFLIFSENREPFWQAMVNNNEVPLYTANYLWQAVLVPPGENTVEFRYPNLWEQSLISAQSYIQSFISKLAPKSH